MNIDIIGTIQNVDNIDPNNPAVEPIPGFHVNTSTPVPEWEQYRVHPKSPRQVFWGVEPTCYRFPDKETFEIAYAELFGNDESDEQENP